MKKEQQRDANRARVEAVIEKMSSGRSAETVDDLTDDFEFELAYGPERKPLRVKGKEAWKQINAATWPAFSSFGLTVTRVHEMLSPDGLILEYRSRGVVKHTGKPYENRYVGIFQFSDGLIRSWTEFHNPEITAESMRADEAAG